MSLQAACASRDISPRKPLFLLGYPHVPRTSTGIHDPLLAAALCLRAGGRGLIMVSVDLLFISPMLARELRQAIAARTGIPPEAILISCTHTHSGPNTVDMLSFQADPVVDPPDPEYLALVKQNIIEAAVEAYQRIEPAEIAFTSAHIDGVGGNRLALDGPRDPRAAIMMLRRRIDRKPLGLSLTYAMHPTVLHEDSTLVSGDFPGLARLFLRDQLGADMTVVYHTGPAGDQSPRNHVRAQTFDEARRLGETLGRAVLASVQALQDSDFRREITLDAAVTRVDLPRRRLPSLTEAEAHLARCRATFDRLRAENAGHGPIRTAECAVFGAEEAVWLARCQENGRLDQVLNDYLPAELLVLRLGDQCCVGLPGEVFIEYSLDIQRRSPRPTTVISLANGDLQGYIVTPEAAAQGTYEANNSLFDPQAGHVLADAAVALIQSLFD